MFKNNADLNIERTKSIYQSINYSYTTLNNKEKLAFELLNLFPDGISLSNFKRCFEKNNSSNSISDKELRTLRDKSLVEDYNGTLQLQPIIRRFAEHQFSKRPKEIKQKYCLDAYAFNCYILDIIEFLEKRRSRSEALKFYSLYKNNLLKVLTYIQDIEIIEGGPVSEKKWLLNYIYNLEDFIVNEKQIQEFQRKLDDTLEYFADLPNAELLINVLNYNMTFYHNEFDVSYNNLAELLSVEEMESRVFSEEDFIERRYKNIISNVHSMEGYTLQRINSCIINDDCYIYLDAHFFYLGIISNISRKKDGFYHFEYELMFKKLNIPYLEQYINSLYLDEHLEIMQCTYTLSKVKKLDKKVIQKLVVTNPYTRGLKELMYAFASTSKEDKTKHFENALFNLSHIKYYYLEGLYYYCQFLQTFNGEMYKEKQRLGLELSSKFHFQYIHFLFSNLENKESATYNFTYEYYPIDGLEKYVQKHNDEWERIIKERE
ncbi:hypothetical protein ACFSJU_03790 [Paradesertivirga mongoliensis]|uniref:Uncharacterized protein n=1 Tax=Paradesertivirga mongoliensis TaxID=2100740 RepID=A0ABW4ZHY6_9SPHI|nr:hypothetical protein [Pedobacter mongoliensis]